MAPPRGTSRDEPRAATNVARSEAGVAGRPKTAAPAGTRCSPERAASCRRSRNAESYRRRLGKKEPRVEQHVGECVPYLARGAQHTEVISPGEHGASPCENSIDGSCEAGRQGLHTAPERLAATRLDDEVSVVALDRVVDDPKRSPLAGRGERLFDLPEDALRPEGRQALLNLQRHVTRKSPSEPFALAMPYGRVRSRLPTGPGTPPTPSAAVERQLGLARSTHKRVE